MIRFLILRLLVPLLILYLVRAILQSLFSGFRSSGKAVPRQQPPRPSVPAGGELKKDPVCGTYVSTAVSVTRTVDGQTLHFCSTQCRDKYRAA